MTTRDLPVSMRSWCKALDDGQEARALVSTQTAAWLGQITHLLSTSVSSSGKCVSYAILLVIHMNDN